MRRARRGRRFPGASGVELRADASSGELMPTRLHKLATSTGGFQILMHSSCLVVMR